MAFDRDSLELLGRALEELDRGFRTLPDFACAASGQDRMGEVLLSLARRLQDNYPYFHPLYAGQMLKPPTRWRGSPTRWPCTSIPTITLWTAAALPRRSKRKRSERSRRCSGGRKRSATLPAAARWPTSKHCGWPGSCSRERQYWRASRRTTRTRAFRACCACRLKKHPATPAAAWTWPRSPVA